jgi:hypothetical protein
MGRGGSSSGFGCIRMKGNSATRSLKVQQQSSSSILKAFNFTAKNNHAWIIVIEKNGFTYISTGTKYINFMGERVEYFGAAYVKIFFPVLLKMNSFDGYD